jgi:hypothetical protein
MAVHSVGATHIRLFFRSRRLPEGRRTAGVVEGNGRAFAARRARVFAHGVVEKLLD